MTNAYAEECEENARETHIRELKEWLGKMELSPEVEHSIAEALYAFSERSLLPEIESISTEEATKVWLIIHRCMVAGFPDNLRM